MNQIPVIKTWPNDAVVEAVQGKIDKVYDYRNVTTAQGPKTVQNAELKDSGGNKIRIVAWEHPDLKAIEGKEVVLHSTKTQNGRFGGVKVVHGSYAAKKDGGGHKAGDTVTTLELSVSKAGNFQLVEVYRAQNPNAAPDPQPASNPVKTDSRPLPAASSGPTPIHGASVGAAINNACAYLTHLGLELDPKKVFEIASGLVKVALHMEKGNLHDPKKEPAKEEKLDSDVPY